ncbi:uncharacterized protein LOC110092407 [Dendrobium catenatum]|uniref:uncharacterized protein LOC110092407 n=1 Tax=Dendrobium catenatum TaxID=906689 RepID=UPI0009F453B4|nr:uncharacterized protein LOC110092407 [Dendrobium catenatum]
MRKGGSLAICEGGLRPHMKSEFVISKGKVVLMENKCYSQKPISNVCVENVKLRNQDSSVMMVRNSDILNVDAVDNAEDGITVKLNVEKETENIEKLHNSLVVKAFGENVPLYVISNELRRQWAQFGNFHITMLGMGWSLCAFEDAKALESVMNNGPWYVNGHIIDMDKWSPMFSPSFLKGLTAPVWIRLPNLPLYCWDEVNVCRIASQVGTPYLIDGSIFQWNRREFARVCVRIKLEDKLPCGVWVEGSYGNFFQKIEFEKISSLCLSCGRIGHLKNVCPEKMDAAMEVIGDQQSSKELNISIMKNDVVFQKKADLKSTEDNHGPWIHVNYGKKKLLNRRKLPFIGMKKRDKKIEAAT